MNMPAHHGAVDLNTARYDHSQAPNFARMLRGNSNSYTTRSLAMGQRQASRVGYWLSACSAERCGVFTARLAMVGEPDKSGPDGLQRMNVSTMECSRTNDAMASVCCGFSISQMTASMIGVNQISAVPIRFNRERIARFIATITPIEECRRAAWQAEVMRCPGGLDRKSTRLNSSHVAITYAD